jgi:hypothetical protein
MERDYNTELDYILEELIREYQILYQSVGFFEGEAPMTIKEKITQKITEKFHLKEWEINILLHHLLIDKYIISIDPLHISLEGIVFRSKGGYTKNSVSQQLENLRLKTIENDLKRYSFGLMIFTAILALGTLVSAWYFGIEIWRFYRGDGIANP